MALAPDTEMTAAAPVFVAALLLATAPGCDGGLDDVFGDAGRRADLAGSAPAPDGGGPDARRGDLAVRTFLLAPGLYAISAVDAVMDGCGSGPAALLGSARALQNDGAGVVAIDGFGEGLVTFNRGTLRLAGDRVEPGCTFRQELGSELEVQDDNRLRLEVTDERTMRQPACTPTGIGEACRTTFALRLAKIS